MGLDMYLREQTYLSHYEHSKGQDGLDGEYERAEKVLKAIEAVNPIVESGGSVTVEHTVAYWRKAHAIHGWFVATVQAGTDNCQEYEVSVENLEELSSACKDVLTSHDMASELLPATDGFFFGMNRESPYDEWYFKDLERTVEMLDPIIERVKQAKEASGKDYAPCWFVYQASW